MKDNKTKQMSSSKRNIIRTNEIFTTHRWISISQNLKSKQFVTQKKKSTNVNVPMEHNLHYLEHLSKQ